MRETWLAPRTMTDKRAPSRGLHLRVTRSTPQG